MIVAFRRLWQQPAEGHDQRHSRGPVRIPPASPAVAPPPDATRRRPATRRHPATRRRPRRRGSPAARRIARRHPRLAASPQASRVAQPPRDGLGSPSLSRRISAQSSTLNTSRSSEGGSTFNRKHLVRLHAEPAPRCPGPGASPRTSRPSLDHSSIPGQPRRPGPAAPPQPAASPRRRIGPPPASPCQPPTPDQPRRVGSPRPASRHPDPDRTRQPPTPRPHNDTGRSDPEEPIHIGPPPRVHRPTSTGRFNHNQTHAIP
jgi:hypothetical protein